MYFYSRIFHNLFYTSISPVSFYIVPFFPFMALFVNLSWHSRHFIILSLGTIILCWSRLFFVLFSTSYRLFLFIESWAFFGNTTFQKALILFFLLVIKLFAIYTCYLVHFVAFLFLKSVQYKSKSIKYNKQTQILF